MLNRELRRVQERSKTAAQKQKAIAQRKKLAEKKKEEKKGIWKRITQFLKESRQELNRVDWPTREEVTNYTAVVLITVAFVSTFLIVLDYVLTHLLQFVTRGLF